MLKLRAASPFVTVERARWREFGGGGTSLGYDELAGLSGLGEPVAVDEMSDVYLPLAKLLELRNRTNRPNLRDNIQPTRPRADLILEKGHDHFVSRILLRRA